MNTSVHDHLYTPLPLPEEMRRWDNTARDHFALPAAALMENAARAALEEIARARSLRRETRILIFMGRGNNGGDGAALARMLTDIGCKVIIVAVGSSDQLDKLPSPADEHYRAARALSVPVLTADGSAMPALPEDWRCPDIVVDALTGTGLQNELRPKELAFVQTINAFRDQAFIVALDSPSGLCGYTGKAMPEAVRAHLTVAFEAPVLGLLLTGAEGYTGRVVTRRVGIPLAVRAMLPAAWRLLSPEKGPWFAPSPLRHKGSAGRVLIVGGSGGMTGAPCLAGLGALRAGAGLAHLAVPAGIAPLAHAGQPEFLVHGIGGNSATWKASHAAALTELMTSIQPAAMVLGPGMGRSPGTQAVLKAVLSLSDRPACIIDADALFFLRPEAKGKGKLTMTPENLLRPEDILTPHPGEAGRMLPPSFFTGGKRSAANPSERERTARVQEIRPHALSALIEQCPAAVVLKGAQTLIGKKDAPFTLSPFAEATLAVGGSGDVLSGVIAALVASGIPSLDAACLGVYLQGRAGALLTAKAPAGHLARDIANAVPAAWKELCEA